MNKPTLTAVAVLATLALGAQVSAQAVAPAPASVGAKTWVGHCAEIEEYLRTAPIERVEEVPLGVTKPKRAFFAPGGPVGSVTFILIDHSRAFAANTMPFEKQMTRIDREMFAKLKALDEAGLMKAVRPFVLGDGPVRDILKRRDKIVARFEKLARERGEAAVFPF